MVDITRSEAIQIIEKITDKESAYWEDIIDDWYDEKEDKWPTIKDVLTALGITPKEYKDATGHEIGN